MARFKLHLLLLLFNAAYCAKLNVPRVLIPLFNDIQVNFTLEVTEGGCYQWSSSREDVVLVRGIQSPNGCSSSGLVTSAARLSHRNTAIILAEDVHTKQILRCDVIVDTIAKLDVITTTRELYVEEAPEAFEIVAFDNQGNEFTTLEGVDFTWALSTPLKDTEVIRIMNFADSSYKASDSLRALEAKGFRGHTALLEGVRTGAAKVIMRLPQKEYAHVNNMEVTLRVVANLLLVPSEASILEGDSVHFKIVQVKEGRLIEMDPSPQYSLEIEHSDIAELHPKTGVATGMTHGQTRIFLRDANADEDTTDFRPPEAVLRVATAKRLQLAGRPVPPSKPWALEVFQHFSIHVHLLDSEDRFMHIGPKTLISVALDNDLFHVKTRTRNGSVVDGVAQESGRVGITATLVSVAGKTIYPKISTAGEMYIYDRIELIPPYVVLDMSSVRPEFQMVATGGDGSYTWGKDGSAIVVDRQGRLTGLTVGKAVVVASLPNNPHINATSSVVVVDTGAMEVVWNDGEASVGSTISLHVALYGQTDKGVISVTSCDNTPFDVKLMDGVNFEYVNEKHRNIQVDKYGAACTILRVKCTEVGGATVAIIRGNLRQEASISCHRPLTRVYPSPQHDALVLAVGSSANVIYSGGPASWSSEVEPAHKISVADGEIATAELYKQTVYPLEYSHAYTVTCLKLGQTEMDVRILRGDTGILLANAKLSVYCHSPYALKITLRHSADSHCPITHPSQVRVLSNTSPLTLQISVVDIKGKVFHNASSLKIKWSSTPSSLAQQQLLHEVMLTQLDEEFSPVPVAAYHYQPVVVTDADLVSEGGFGEIVGEITGYWNSMLREVGATRTPPLNETPRGAIKLRTVKPLRVSHEKITLYNSPSNEGILSIYHGSGHVDVLVSQSNVVRDYLDKNGEILRLQILNDGQTTLTIKDKCLPSPAVIVQVSVVSAYGIFSDLPPLIEKGATVECRAFLADRLGASLPKNTVGAPNITAIPGNIVGEVTVTGPVFKTGDAVFKVTGLETGDARIDFSSHLLSTSSPTHVFPPLRIVPAASVLLRGSSIALTTVGGPPPPSTIVFYQPADVQSGNVIKVHPGGIMDALAIGMTKVEARAELGGVSYGRASAGVRVIHLEGVNIHAPTAKLLVGNSMPLWATGISDDIGPLELGSQPSLHFTWSVSGDGGAIVYDVLSDTNMEIEDRDRVSVRLRAVKSGRAKIHLNVTSDRGSIAASKRHTWSSTLDLIFVDPLQLIAPAQSSVNLLLAPDSNTKLKTNYRTDKVTYRIIEEDNSQNSPLVTVSSQGVLKSYSRLGRAVLHITGVDDRLETEQHITLAIEIVPVSYTMLNLQSYPNLNGLQALPQGLHLNVVGHRHDSLGRLIAGLSTNLEHYNTRSDIVNVKTHSNDSVEVFLSEPGRSVLELTDVGSEYSDYVLLKVSPAIYPSQFVATVGDWWCCRSGVAKASWSSSDPRSLSVSSSGLVQALADGPAPAHIILEAEDVDMQASSTVQIRHADKIMFLHGEIDHIFTDEKPYVVPLVIYNLEETNKFTNILSSDTDCLSHEISVFPFSCEVKHLSDSIPQSQLTIEPVLDLETKRYGCRLSWTPTLSLQPYHLNDNADVTAVSSSNNFSSAINSGDTRVLVIARLGPNALTQVNARGVRAASPITKSLHLSPPPALAAQLDIIAPVEVLAQLKVVSEEELLSVEGPEKVSEIMSRYIVSGKKGSSRGILRSHIRVVSPLTRQNMEIPVNFGSSAFQGGVCPGGGSSPLVTLLENNLGYLVALVVIGITVYFINRYFKSAPATSRIPVQSPPGYSDPALSPVRNMTTFVSRSPMSTQHQLSPSLRSPQYSPGMMQRTSPSQSDDSMVYGDASYLPSPDRRRNRRLI